MIDRQTNRQPVRATLPVYDESSVRIAVVKYMTARKRTMVLSCLLVALALAIAAIRHFSSAHHILTIDLTKINISVQLAQEGKYLTVAATYARASKQVPSLVCNGPIFGPGYRPIGLLVIDSKQIHPLNRDKGVGNFYLQPNGVFFVERDIAGILATDVFARKEQKPCLAFQSGPILVANGEIPEAITRLSGAEYSRSAIGILANGHIAIVHTENQTTLGAFARLLATTCKLEHALYLDGAVCGYQTPQRTRNTHHQLAMTITVVPR